MSKYTFQQFQAEYPDDAACLAKIMETQYGGTVFTCPKCGVVDAKFHRIGKRRGYACQECGHHIFPCAGTIFEKSSTNLTKWFFAMYLFTSTRHGVAAKELQRQIGVTYKTAWRMCHELRKLMASADDGRPLFGHVEIDETWVGGRQPGARGNPKKGRNKSIVFGMVERGGNVRAGVLPAFNLGVAAQIIGTNIVPGTIISTDEANAYNALQVSPYNHGTVNHSAEEWVRGIHHTNTIEGHWSQLKRSIKGTHVSVSAKHLWKYVSEFSYRRNNRHSHRAMFYRLVAAFSLPRLAES